MQSKIKNVDHVKELMNMGVGRFVAYANYTEVVSGKIVETFVWHWKPDTCLSRISTIMEGLEKQKGETIALGNIHVSDLHRCNTAIREYLYEKVKQLKSYVDEIDGFHLITSPDDLQECSSIIFSSEVIHTGISLDSAMGSGGMIN